MDSTKTGAPHLKPYTVLVYDPDRPGIIQVPLMATNPKDVQLQWTANQIRVEHITKESVNGYVLAIYEGHLTNLYEKP